MAGFRFAALQSRPMAFLDCTSVTLDAFPQLVPPCEAAFQARMTAWRMDGQPRTARRFPVDQHCPLPTPEERLLFLLTSLKTYALQVVHGRLFGMVQGKANQWIRVLSRWPSTTGLWVAAIVRGVFGAALWCVAPSSRTPVVLQMLAVVSGVSALVLPFVGVARFTALFSWWSRQAPAVVRAWSTVAVGTGGFLFWSVGGHLSTHHGVSGARQRGTRSVLLIAPGTPGRLRRRRTGPSTPVPAPRGADQPA